MKLKFENIHSIEADLDGKWSKRSARLHKSGVTSLYVFLHIDTIHTDPPFRESSHRTYVLGKDSTHPETRTYQLALHATY